MWFESWTQLISPFANKCVRCAEAGVSVRTAITQTLKYYCWGLITTHWKNVVLSLITDLWVVCFTKDLWEADRHTQWYTHMHTLEEAEPELVVTTSPSTSMKYIKKPHEQCNHCIDSSWLLWGIFYFFCYTPRLTLYHKQTWKFSISTKLHIMKCNLNSCSFHFPVHVQIV